MCGPCKAASTTEAHPNNINKTLKMSKMCPKNLPKPNNYKPHSGRVPITNHA